MATAATARATCVEAPLSLVRIPPLIPWPALLCSVLLHVLLVEFGVGLHLVFFDTLELHVRTPADLIRAGEYRAVISLPELASLGGGSAGRESGRPGKAVAGGKGDTPARAAGGAGAMQMPKTVYAGPQQIVSNPPQPTNTVQTIRRPDLLAPPKLKFPLRAQTLLMVPPVPREVLLAPPPVPAVSAPVPKPAIAAERPPTEAPLTIRKAERNPASIAPEPPRMMTAVQPIPILAAPTRSMPQLQSSTDTADTRTALVLNAVTLPPDTPKQVPDAELLGSFAVVPAQPSRKNGGNDQSDGVTTVANGHGNGSGTAVGGNGNVRQGRGDAGLGGAGLGGTGSEAGTGAAGNGKGTGGGIATGAGTGNGSGNGTGSGSGSGGGTGSGRGSATGGSGTGTERGSGAGAGPATSPNPFGGISIMGGSASGGRVSRPAAQEQRPRYGITIIAGGASGGAVKDLGVFAREETVYTVYVSMADAGGGPDWPMEYALLSGPGSARDALLTPPYAVKKLRPQHAGVSPAGKRLLVRGVVTEHGQLEQLAVLQNPSPELVQVALEALAKWEFLPAQLQGKPVATKVLISATVMPPQ